MADEEIRFIHRQETFTDLAVRELAKTQAACYCKIQGKRCSKSKCESCIIHKRLKNCKDNMNDYDLSRLHNYTAQYYTEYADNPMAWMSYKEYTSYYAKVVLRILLCFVVLAGCLACLFMFMGCNTKSYEPDRGPLIVADPKDTYKPDPHFYDSRIINTIKEVQANLKDITGDGEINCQDAAISFKIIWNDTYPRMQNKIQIGRNYNPPIMDHLFVYIWVETGERIDIEPRCFNPYRFEMKDTWGDKYDPKYNWYGETDWWLDKAGYYDY